MRRNGSLSRSWRLFSRALCAALAQAGLWAIVYLLTGVALDWLAGRPPRFEVVWEHWRTGFIKGAIYGALFMGLILIAALILRVPGAPRFLTAARCLSARFSARSSFRSGKRSSAAPTERRRSSGG